MTGRPVLHCSLLQWRRVQRERENKTCVFVVHACSTLDKEVCYPFLTTIAPVTISLNARQSLRLNVRSLRSSREDGTESKREY